MQRSSLALIGGVAAVSVVAAVVGMTPLAADGAAAQPPHRSHLSVGPAMPGFAGAVTWLNSAPLTPEQLRGKVVLVDFWTYSCINCIRTLPYVRAWAEKYRDQGLVVVGVHSPEFRFEKDLSNVSAALARFQIDFPIAVDSDHRIWQAWGNRGWPAYHLVDAQGKVRLRHIGEGRYDALERAIQSLLAERRGAPVDTTLVAPTMTAELAPPDLRSLASGETYVGYDKAADFRSRERLAFDAVQAYTVGPLALNQWGLQGQWVVRAESAAAAQAGSGVVHQFSARDLHLVMGAGTAARPVRIQVTLDGQPPGADHGADIDAAGHGVITSTRLHQLIRQSGPVRPRRFEVRFLDAGAEVYAFTFG